MSSGPSTDASPPIHASQRSIASASCRENLANCSRFRALSSYSIITRPSGTGTTYGPTGWMRYPYRSSRRSRTIVSGIRLITYESVVTRNSGRSGHGRSVAAAPPVLCRASQTTTRAPARAR